jgi:hypothetical protein
MVNFGIIIIVITNPYKRSELNHVLFRDDQSLH